MPHYDYPMPAITADVMLFRNNESEILLLRRAIEPFKDCWVFPGGHFDVGQDESILHCAARELREETGLTVDLGSLQFWKYFDQKDRDPRGRYVTFVFVASYKEVMGDVKPADDAKDFQWADVRSILNGEVSMAFDHLEIMRKMFKR